MRKRERERESKCVVVYVQLNSHLEERASERASERARESLCVERVDSDAVVSALIAPSFQLDSDATQTTKKGHDWGIASDGSTGMRTQFPSPASRTQPHTHITGQLVEQRQTDCSATTSWVCLVVHCKKK